MTAPPRIRSFVVGAPRSGTTLLQSLLAAHPRLTSFPETHFFDTFDPGGFFDRLQSWRHRELRDHMAEYFNRIDEPDWARAFERWYPSRGTYARIFVQALDDLALRERADGWLEKTPIHLEHVETIESFVPRPKFVHIVRSGADTVASLHAVTHAYPEAWSGARSVERCMDRWIRSVRLTSHYVDSPNHVAVRYEALARKPEVHLRRVLQFLGLSYDAGILDAYEQAAEEVVEEQEAWKESNRGAIREPNSDRFYGRFDASERRRILQRLREAETEWRVEPAGDPPEQE